MKTCKLKDKELFYMEMDFLLFQSHCITTDKK
jgi:hypothetical protein